MGIVGDIVRGAVGGAIDGLKGGHGHRAGPTTVNNYMSGGHPPTPPGQWILVEDDSQPQSDLALTFASSEENYPFTVDQPVMLYIFSLTDPAAEIVGGCELGDRVIAEVEPDIYGVLAIVFMDEDEDEIDGVGFDLAAIDAAGLYELEIGIVETNDEGLDEILTELDEVLEELASVGSPRASTH